MMSKKQARKAAKRQHGMKVKWYKANTTKQTRKKLQRGWQLVQESGQESWFWGSSYSALLRYPPEQSAWVNQQMPPYGYPHY